MNADNSRISRRLAHAGLAGHGDELRRAEACAAAPGTAPSCGRPGGASTTRRRDQRTWSAAARAGRRRSRCAPGAAARSRAAPPCPSRSPAGAPRTRRRRRWRDASPRRPRWSRRPGDVLQTGRGVHHVARARSRRSAALTERDDGLAGVDARSATGSPSLVWPVVQLLDVVQDRQAGADGALGVVLMGPAGRRRRRAPRRR